VDEVEDASSCEGVVDLFIDRVNIASGRLQLDVDGSSTRGNIVVRGSRGGSVWSLSWGFWGGMLELEEVEESSSLCCSSERGSRGGIESLSLSVVGKDRIGLSGIVDVVL
jgi:hypothetical protein